MTERTLRFAFPDERGVTGTGLAATAGGRLDLRTGASAIKQGIQLLLSTLPGERVMRPQYGCDLGELVFREIDGTTMGVAMYYVRRAIETWEPRVQITRLDAIADPDRPGTLAISLEYEILQSRAIDALEFSVDLAGGS